MPWLWHQCMWFVHIEFSRNSLFVFSFYKNWKLLRLQNSAGYRGKSFSKCDIGIKSFFTDTGVLSCYYYFAFNSLSAYLFFSSLSMEIKWYFKHKIACFCLVLPKCLRDQKRALTRKFLPRSKYPTYSKYAMKTQIPIKCIEFVFLQ